MHGLHSTGEVRAMVRQEELKREIVLSRTAKPTERLGELLVALCSASVAHSGVLRASEDIEEAISRSVYNCLRAVSRIDLNWPADRILPYLWPCGINAAQDVARRRASRERNYRRLHDENRPDRHYTRNAPR